MNAVLTTKYKIISGRLLWIDIQLAISAEIGTPAHVRRIDDLLDQRLKYMQQRDEYFGGKSLTTNQT